MPLCNIGRTIKDALHSADFGVEEVTNLSIDVVREFSVNALESVRSSGGDAGSLTLVRGVRYTI